MVNINLSTNLIALYTIIRNEIARIIRIWIQTLLPPAITISLYFIIFGTLIGPRVGSMQGYPYVTFIAPGLIMMSIISNAYTNVVSSFYGARFQRSIEEILISPTPNLLMMLGYVTGGIIRGLSVGLVATIIALCFTHLSLHSTLITILVVLLCSLFFSLAGFLNGILANSFDDTSIIPTFVLTPLIYLGGVFYSIDLLSPFWQTLSVFNPIVYMINAFRYGMLGVSDINIYFAILMIALSSLLLFLFNWWLLKRGIGLRS